MKYLLIIISFSVSSFLYSQDCSYTFYGEVVDLHLNEGLNRAKVLIDNGNEIIANQKGEFIIDGICKGQHTLVISHPNCKEITINIDIPNTSTKKIYLEHHITELEEIIVSTSSNRKESITSIEDVIDRQKIFDFKSKNFGEVLEQLSGVSSYKMGNSIVKPLLHGVTGSRVGIIKNGIRLQDNEWGADHAPSLDLSSIETIQLIKGAGALKYAGDAVGGIIKTNFSRSSLMDSLYGYGSIGYTDNGRGSYVISKISKSFSGGINYGGTISLKSNGDYNSPNYSLSNSAGKKIASTLFFSKNRITKEWGIRYSFFRQDIGILKSAHVGSLGDLARTVKSDIPLTIYPYSREIDNPKQENEHHTLSLYYKSRGLRKLKWDLNYSYQSNSRKEYDLRRGEFRNIESLNILLQTHDLLFDTFFSSNENFAFKSGLSLQFQDNFSNPRTGIRRLIPDHNRYKLGVYGITEFNYSDNFKLEFGSRIDFDRINSKKYYKKNDWDDNNYGDEYASTIIRITESGKILSNQVRSFSNFSSSFGAKKIFKNETSAAINLAYSSRSPNPAELFSDGLHHALATIETGNLRLVPEKSFKTLISVENNYSKIKYTLTFYNSNIKDFIILQPSEDGFDLTTRGAFLKRDYRQISKVVMRGIDLDIGIDISKNIKFSTSGSYLRAFEDNDTPLVDMPPFNLRNQIEFSVFKKSPVFLRISSEYVAQQNYYPDLNFNYNFLENGVIYSDLVDVSTPPDSYNLLNIEIKKNFLQKFKTRLYIENVLNTEYRNYLNRLRFFAAEPGRLMWLELRYRF